MRHTHSTRYGALLSVFVIVALFAITARAGAPLKGVDVKLGKNPGGSPMYSARTDEHGKFVFPNLPPGVYSLYISYDEVSKITIDEPGVHASRSAIKEDGPKKSGIALGDPGVNGTLTTHGDSGAAQKKWLPANFRLELDEANNVAVAVPGEASMKRQHSGITITKDWSTTSSKVTVTLTSTANVSGNISSEVSSPKADGR